MGGKSRKVVLGHLGRRGRLGPVSSVFSQPNKLMAGTYGPVQYRSVLALLVEDRLICLMLGVSLYP